MLNFVLLQHFVVFVMLFLLVMYEQSAAGRAGLLLGDALRDQPARPEESGAYRPVNRLPSR